MYPKFVYFIQGEKTRLIKIGMAANIGKRLKTLRASSPDHLKLLALIYTDQGDGVYLREFSKSREHGEWFKPTSDLIDFVNHIMLLPTGIPFELLVGIEYTWRRGEVAE